MFKDFKLEIKLEPGGIPPTRATNGDAGLDFYCPTGITMSPRVDIKIPLQIRTSFPKGYALIIKEKSGVATKLKLDVGACVVDAQYRGIVHAHLFNNSDDVVHIESGQKIVQGIIVPVWTGQPIFVDVLDMNTERGEGGFGSTGIK